MTTSTNNIPVVTSENLPGFDIVQALGIAKGSTVRAKHLGSDIVAGLRTLVGGEVKEYAQLLVGSREQAMDRMLEDARAQGADAIVAMRMQTSAIQDGASEVLCYGTAVRIKTKE